MAQVDAGALRVPRFARGFILSEAEVEAPVPGWSSEWLLGLHLTHAPDVGIIRAEYAGSTVVVLGRFVDTGRWLPAPAAVSVAAEALARSTAEFLDLSDAWSGRYLVLYGDATSRHVMTDAAGMRSAFYTLDGPFVLATHAPLVATIVRAAPSPVGDAYQAAREQGKSAGAPLRMPGRATPWVGVVALTANMALDLPDRVLHRIFPRGGLPTMDVETAASSVGPRLRGQVEALVATGQPVALSVTAGRDSRVSLAASRTRHDDITYFTYARAITRADDWDVSTASSIAREVGLSHRVLDLDSVELAPRLREAISEANIINHSPRLVAAYQHAFTSDTIHIRSNIGEIGRSFYRSKEWAAAIADAGPALTPEAIARLWSRDTLRSQVVVEAFDDWMQAVGFLAVDGMDPLDVLYWEHRMPCWHSNVVLESDFAFETHILFNARTILRDLLAVPADARAGSKVFEQLVADMWPELARWPYKRPTRPTTATPKPTSARKALRRRVARLVGR